MGLDGFGPGDGNFAAGEGDFAAGEGDFLSVMVGRYDALLRSNVKSPRNFKLCRRDVLSEILGFKSGAGLSEAVE